MKSFNLKQIIGFTIGLTAIVWGGGGDKVAAQTPEVKYPTRPPANGSFACVGDTILITATADDLIVPEGSHWGGDTYVKNEGGKITKRFFTYHPYMETDPTVQKSRDFKFTTVKGGVSQEHTVTIAAKSCPPTAKAASIPKETTSYGGKYNLGYISFDYVFNNETSNLTHILFIPVFDPAQPFRQTSMNRTKTENQLNANYRVIQFSDASYTIEILYNEGDSTGRKFTHNYGTINLREQLGTLTPDQTGYCPGNDIVFKLELSTDWQNVLNQTTGNDESKIGACFDWSGSPSPVTFTRREGNKYFFSTTTPGSGTGSFQCKMTANIQYQNANNNPAIIFDSTAIYDVPIVQPTLNEKKGFTIHEISACQDDAIDLTSLIEPGTTVTRYWTKSGTPITNYAAYKATQSDVVYAEISAPCPWTDELQVNIIDKAKIQIFSMQYDTLICAGADISFSATANSPITWNISYNSGTGESLPDVKSGEVITRTFPEDATVQAIVNKCGAMDWKDFKVQVVTPPTASLDPSGFSDPKIKYGCPYELINWNGTCSGCTQSGYRLYDLRNKKDLTGAYLTSTGLTGYPIRPNDSLRLTYTADNQANGNTANTRPTALTCSNSTEAKIIAYPLPPLRINYDGTAYTDGNNICVPRDAAFTLTASGANTYTWLDAKPSPAASTDQTLTLPKDSLIRMRGVENVHQCFDTMAVRCVVSVDKADRVTSAAGCPGTELCFEADELPNTDYAWYDPDGKALPNETKNRLCRTFQAGQNGVYTLLTQRFGCTESLDYTLTLHPAPDIDARANTIWCVGEELVLNYYTGLPDTETPHINFTKDGESKAQELEELNGDLYRYRKPDVQTSDAGRYIFKVTTDNACTDSDTIDIIVEEPAVVRIALNADSACEEAAGRLTAEVTPPSDIYTYKWSIDGHAAGGDSPTLSLNWERNDKAIHLVVEQSACTSTADTVVTIIPVPHLSGMPQDTGICQGLTICLNPVSDIAPQEVIWYWIDQSGKLIQTPLPNLQFCQDDADESMNGRYFVEAAALVGTKRCAGHSDTTRLTVYPTPDIRIDGPTFICDGSTVTLTAHSRIGGTYLWTPGNTTTEAISVTQAAQYTVTVTSAYGCHNSAAITLEARPTPYFSLPPDTSICRGTSIMIYGPDGMDDYHWNDGMQDKDHIAEQGGWYILTVYRNECPYSDSIYVKMTFCGQFHFPTAFTPNDNRVNDTWGAISAAKDEDMAEYDLMVFDRNGKKVFHGKRISEQWDGRYKGELCPPGVYMYSFKALEKLEGIKYQANGTVTIVQ